MRQNRETARGLFQPSGLWMFMLAGLLLTVTSSTGQDSKIKPPGKFRIKKIGNVPETTQTVSYDDSSLVISNAALDADFDLVVQPLDSTQLSRLDPGMTNVTKGVRSAYRMLPHGKKYLKEISITLPYDKASIPPGSGPESLRTYFYDDVAKSWTALPLARVDTVACTLTSLTDHFTDFINATVTVPDHPGLASFNPTELSGITAADPGAGIALISPPQPNPTGAANLGYPLDLPPGRGGVHPGLSVHYSSAGGNSWMGMGWSLSVPCVTIDTRWGVPRYTPDLETETYLLSGDQLTPLAHREDWKPREAEKNFHRRVEGSFERIVRHGDHPLNYWWEVTDKSGNRRFYGGDPTLGGAAPDTTLASANGIFHWALREIRDPNGNFVRYHYAKVEDTGIANGSVPGADLYLQSITYTGAGTQEGPYRVTFVRDRELGEGRRPDVMIDCRGGFKRVTTDLLRRVEVSLNGALIRRYELRYREGAFRKTLLEAIVQYGEDGTTEFNRHTFEYFDDIRTAQGAYRGFASQTPWSVPNDGLTLGLLDQGKATALSASETNSRGGHLYVGVGASSTKSASGGFKVGYQRSDSKGMVTLVDIDGDGLPDKVYRRGGGLKWRRNLGFNPVTGSGSFDETERPVIGISEISRDRSTTWSAGAEAHIQVISLYANFAQTMTDGSVYFADANGDGFIDLVSRGRVFFGRPVNGIPTFTENSGDTPVPVGGGAVNHLEIIEDLEALYQEQLQTFPLADTLRRWVAPRDGVVSIVAPVTLIQDFSDERLESKTADGVRVAIQLNAAELWSQTIAKDDYAPKTPTGVDAIPVTKGDRIYFRVGSIEQGLFDLVEWDPLVTYAPSPGAPVVDQNGRDIDRYKASEDWTYAGRRTVAFPAPITGTIRVDGSFEKLGPTTDDIRLQVLKNGMELYGRDFARGATETVAISQDVVVAPMDSIEIRVKIDSQIDVTKLRFAPRLYYVAAPPDVTIQDNQGNYIFELPGVYAVDLYPVNTLNGPQETWSPAADGTFHIVSEIVSDGNFTTNGELVLTAKAGGLLLGKGTVMIQNGAVTQAAFDITAASTDKVFFDLSTRDPGLKDHLILRRVKIPKLPEDEILPHTLHEAGVPGLFPEAFRGWSVAGYNANDGRETTPVNEARLVFDPADYQGDAPNKTVKAYSFYPQPRQNRWQGPDDLGWVAQSQMSSSRLGLDEVQVPRPNDFLNLRAPVRLSKSRQFAVGGGFDIPVDGFGGGLSGSVSTGTSESLVDYLDLNGDRFPDILGNGKVQFTVPTGGVSDIAAAWGAGKVRMTKTQAWNAGVGGSLPLKSGNSQSRMDDSSVLKKDVQSGLLSVPFGATGGYAASRSEATEELIDVNGDGLPDRVKRVDNGLEVRLNLGYGFADAETWNGANPHDGESSSASIGGNLGFNYDKLSYGGGLSLSRSETRTRDMLTDLNGDGLPDRVKPDAGGLKVQFNEGGSFGPAVFWPGGSIVARGGDITLGAGAYFTIPIYIPIVSIYILINPGFDLSQGVGRQEWVLKDVDGDGYEDQLTSDNDGDLRCSRNQTGKTNLLRMVHRPLGATVTLDYQRKGNTLDDPGSRWVLARTELDDGHPGDGVDVQVTRYAYENGKHDRLEREFLGYARVINDSLDPSNGDAVVRSVVQDYRNDSVYTKGLLVRSRSQDAAGRPFIERENTYLLRDVTTGVEPAAPASLTATIFPMAVRTDQRFFEGQAAAQKSTYATQEYDALGNVTRLVDTGDLGAQDDVEARVTYANFAGPYIVGKADSIRVFGNGVLQRRREAAFDPATGNPTQVRQYLADGSFAVTDLDYFPDGNLRSVTGPANHRGQRYALAYEYDATVKTHVVRISDSFGYTSTAAFNFKHALVTSTVDTNANEVRRAYDTFGRLVSLTSPYDVSATIRCEYHPEAGIPWARTRHLDAFRDPNDPIETVLFTDGLKRVIQTKKDATVHVAPGAPAQELMTVSGHVTFDFLGRAVEQRYPTTEPLGTPGGFNPAIDPVAPTKTEYDVLDRPVKVTIPDGTSTMIQYGFGPDRDGVLQFSTTTIDANLNRQAAYHDIRNLETSLQQFNVQKGQTIWTSFSYNALREFVRSVDDRGNVTRAEYDFFGRRTALDAPDTGRTTQEFDLAGNLVSRVTANLRAGNKAVTFQYDFGRLLSITYPTIAANNVTFEYGAPGAPFNRAARLQKITDAGGTAEKFYGKLGELLKETRFMRIDVPGNNDADRTFTTQFVYDSFNRLQRMTYPDGEVLTYAYDSGGMLRSAQGVLGPQSRTYLARMEYDKFGQKAFTALGNGITTSYAYNDQNRRLDTLASAQAGQAPFQSLKYGYDAVGNILQLQSQVGVPAGSMGGPTTQTFQYDSLYRLTHAEGTFTGNFQGLSSSTYTLDMDYDTLHNILAKSQGCKVNGKPDQTKSYALSYQYQSPRPHAPTRVGNRDFTYDLDGNQASYAGKDDFGSNGNVRRDIVWDEDDRMASVSDQGGNGNGNTTSFVYDHAGRRVIKRSSGHELAYINGYFTVRNRDHQMLMTKHVLVGSARIAATAIGGTLTAAHQEVSFFYFHSDHLGSADFLSDGQGKLRQHNEYLPFGETWVSQVGDNSDQVKENAYLFTGKEFDSETGLYYFGARYYDPRTCIWESADPVVRSSGVYTYASNNPINRIDPQGFDDKSPFTLEGDLGKNETFNLVLSRVLSTKVGKSVVDELNRSKQTIAIRLLPEAKIGSDTAGQWDNSGVVKTGRPINSSAAIEINKEWFEQTLAEYLKNKDEGSTAMIAKVLWHELAHAAHDITNDESLAGEPYKSKRDNYNEKFKERQSQFLKEYETLYEKDPDDWLFAAQSTEKREEKPFMKMRATDAAGNVKEKAGYRRELRTEYMLAPGRIQEMNADLFKGRTKPGTTQPLPPLDVDR